jgi:hypothetical protein
MKKIIKIDSVRKYVTWPSWDLVYEWEDVMQHKLNLKMCYKSKHLRYVNKLIPIIGYNIFSSFYNSDNCHFLWDMSAFLKDRYDNRTNIIPCIIDFHLRKEQIPDFLMAYRKNPLILISSAKVYSFLRNKISKPIFHYPLSISDKYTISSITKYHKEYDVVLMGRSNPILNGYLEEYIKKNPDFTYVYRKQKNNQFFYYTSTGDLLGDINTREQYVELMRKSRIGLYATPGIDGGEIRTNGFNQVTPRFLELLSCGCHIIARYVENDDTDFYQLNDFCPSINSYEEFEVKMNYARSNEVDMENYSSYLKKHYTSKRVQLLNEIMKRYNNKRNSPFYA